MQGVEVPAARRAAAAPAPRPLCGDGPGIRQVCALRPKTWTWEGPRSRPQELRRAPDEPARFEKDPKSDAGKRTVMIPPHVLPVLQHHAETFASVEFFFVDRYGHRVRGNAEPAEATLVWW